MNIGLIDLKHPRPNLALMKLSTYHNDCGDKVHLNKLVLRTGINYISCIFDKDKQVVDKLLNKYPNSVAGGPGYDAYINLPKDVDSCKPDYSLYNINYGLGRLTSGCPNDCPWCVVPSIEGNLVHTVNTVDKLINPSSNKVVLYDSNFLSCVDAPDHLQDIIDRKLSICFDQGLDIRLVNDFYANLLSKIKTESFTGRKRMFYFAWDKPEIEYHVVQGIKLLGKAGIKPYRLTFYVLCGYNTTIREDLYRVLKLKSLGVDPFVMAYDKTKPYVKDLARWCNRKQLFKSCTFKEYIKQKYSKR